VFLVFHGFAGNPAQMTGLIDVLSVYDGNIITPRIYGHFDQNMDDLDDVTFEQWLDQGRAALSVAQGLGETVIVAGYSLVHRLAQNSQVSFGLGAFAGLGPAIALTIGDADQIVASPFVQREIGRVQPNIPPIIIADEGHLFFIQSSDLYESGQALGRRFIDSVQALVRDVAR
jgi:hypothetical protein